MTSQKLKVKVTFVIDPDNFWAQIGNDRLFELYETSLRILKNSLGEKKKVKDCTNECNLFVMSPSVGEWRRAELVRVSLSSAEIDVFYTDFGTTELIKMKHDCYILSPILAQNPPHMAHRCRLAGIKAISSRWTPRAIKRFQDLTLNKTLEADILPTITNECFLNIYTSEHKSVTEILLDEEFGIIAKAPPFMLTSPPHMPATSASDNSVGTMDSNNSAEMKVSRVPSFDVDEILKTYTMTAAELAEKVMAQQQESARENAVMNSERIREELLAEKQLYVGKDFDMDETVSSPTSPAYVGPTAQLPSCDRAAGGTVPVDAKLSSRELAIQNMISQSPIPSIESTRTTEISDAKSPRYGQGIPQLTKTRVDATVTKQSQEDSQSSIDTQTQLRIFQVIEDMQRTGQVKPLLVNDLFKPGTVTAHEAILRSLLESVLIYGVENANFMHLSMQLVDFIKDKRGFPECVSEVLWRLQTKYIRFSETRKISDAKLGYCHMIASLFKVAADWPDSCSDPVKIFLVNTLQKWISFHPKDQEDKRDIELLEAMYTDCFMRVCHRVASHLQQIMASEWKNLMDDVAAKILQAKSPMLIKKELLKFVISEATKEKSVPLNNSGCQTDASSLRHVGCNTTQSFASSRSIHTQTHEDGRAGGSVAHRLLQLNNLSPAISQETSPVTLITPQQFSVNQNWTSNVVLPQNNVGVPGMYTPNIRPVLPQFVQPMIRRAHSLNPTFVQQALGTKSSPSPEIPSPRVSTQHNTGSVPYSRAFDTNQEQYLRMPSLEIYQNPNMNAVPVITSMLTPGMLSHANDHQTHDGMPLVTTKTATLSQDPAFFHADVTEPPVDNDLSFAFEQFMKDHETETSMTQAERESHDVERLSSNAMIYPQYPHTSVFSTPQGIPANAPITSSPNAQNVSPTFENMVTKDNPNYYGNFTTKSQTNNMNLTFNQCTDKPLNITETLPVSNILTMNIPVASYDKPILQSELSLPASFTPNAQLNTISESPLSPEIVEKWSGSSSDSGDDNDEGVDERDRPIDAGSQLADLTANMKGESHDPYLNCFYSDVPVSESGVTSHDADSVPVVIDKSSTEVAAFVDGANEERADSVTVEVTRPVTDQTDDDAKSAQIDGVDISAYNVPFDDYREHLANEILEEYRNAASTDENPSVRQLTIPSLRGLMDQLHAQVAMKKTQSKAQIKGHSGPTSVIYSDSNLSSDTECVDRDSKDKQSDSDSNSKLNNVVGGGGELSTTPHSIDLASNSGVNREQGDVLAAPYMLKSKKDDNEFIGTRKKKSRQKDRPAKWKSVIRDIVSTNIPKDDPSDETVNGDGSETDNQQIPQRNSPPPFAFGPRKCAICGDLNHITTDCNKRENFFF